MTSPTLKLVLCWHMHQPQYRHPVDGHYLKPWTWLHGIKDYADMAAHLETVQGARAVVNFSTILLEQLADYASRIERWRLEGAPVGDLLLDGLGGHLPGAQPDRRSMIEACLHANKAHMIEAFPAFSGLIGEARASLSGAAALDDATLRDLLLWYHLAWTGESLRRGHPLIGELLQKARGYTAEDGRQLLVLIGNVLQEIIPRYRRLAESGVVELSVTPHAHPILPLLMDLGVAQEAMPGAPMPPGSYPGGRERCAWHLARACQAFDRHFGQRPIGCWPSEGGVSTETLELLGETGFAWTATGTGVLRNSLDPAPPDAHCRAWRLSGEHPGQQEGPTCFFRDDDLSDRIGFQYSNWDAEHAVQDFVARLESLLHDWQDAAPPVVSIIMDGENAWEHYPYNAWFFLRHFYATLAGHPRIELTTYRELLAQNVAVDDLPRLVAGSWVYGNFAVWIGDPHKNRAWELLSAAKLAADRVLARPDLGAGDRAAIEEQLAVCEGSDWFWWLGGDNRPEDSLAFDNLFRLHLESLYHLLGERAPDDLQPIVDMAGSPDTADVAREGGTMRRAGR